ncbi:hypothetical protein [Micromonospora inositola]|uniref:hypothetical protein n=1 Tax=Micromonospora inositola TaxID=47865 RepID=UPI00155FE320|nr:hypothetical protein [Micromonospora inositola]
MAQPAGGDQDAVRISHPATVCCPKVVRNQVGQAGALDRTVKFVRPAVVALPPAGGPLLSTRREEGVQVLGPLGEVLTEPLDHERRQGESRRW